jgi:hypothetical protein
MQFVTLVHVSNCDGDLCLCLCSPFAINKCVEKQSANMYYTGSQPARLATKLSNAVAEASTAKYSSLFSSALSFFFHIINILLLPQIKHNIATEIGISKAKDNMVCGQCAGRIITSGETYRYHHPVPPPHLGEHGGGASLVAFPFPFHLAPYCQKVALLQVLAYAVGA